MSRIIKNLELSLDENLKEKLLLLAPGFTDFRILKQSVDARRRHDVKLIYTVEISENHEVLEIHQYHVTPLKNPPEETPIIIGSGPAGLFAALRLIERGIPCRLFERGSKAELRIKGINRFWRYGELDRRNNVCYGEGGAGLYSDGKLITRIKSDHIPYVLQRLVKFGAPAEIEYLSNPHVGSDRIRRVIPIMRQYLQENGCEFHYDTQVTELMVEKGRIAGIKTEKGEIFHSPKVVLCTGHSAEDMLLHLHDLGVKMEGKSFAMGLRIEHPQKLINKIQYREQSEHPKLGSANYKLTFHDQKTDTGVYSFCMCPGGFVLSSGTEADALVCNGMSNYNRNSPFANAAIVVTINHENLFGNDIMGGLKLRKDIEQKAYRSVQSSGGGRQLPAQKLNDFLDKKNSIDIPKGSCPSGTVPVNLHHLFPSALMNHLATGIQNFNKSMSGFISDDSVLYGVETRTSCPIRVTRDDESLQSTSHPGLFPCGEGAGYAGGITSAACDGVKIAEKIFESYC